MASGSFSSSVCKAAGEGFYRYIEVEWSSTNDATKNESTITWTAYSRSPDPSTTKYVYATNIVVTIAGTHTTVVGSTAKALYKDAELGSGSVTVSHGSNGKKSVNVSITAQIYSYGVTNSSYSGSITMTQNPVYTLSMSAGTGSSITVNRTSSPAGSTGNLSDGTGLYYDDELKITFEPSSNYRITTRTVNSSDFTSGNTYTVTGDVTVKAKATPLKSSVAATDANIGSTTTITITRHNSSYTHTLTYSFGGATETIATKTSNTSVAWTVPTSFYAKIPNDPSGTCTITCTTYNGNTSLGSSTCTFTATAAESSNKPTVTGTVVDTNTVTKALTGNSSVLIKNKSTALCTLTATPKNSATISEVKIGGGSVTGSTSSEVVTAEKTYSNVTATSFAFYAIDSRDYDNTVTVSPSVVNYITLTCTPSIYRDTPTGNTISMDVSGNFYKGSFGAYSNTLTLKYRYKQVGGSYPSTSQTLEDGTSSDANGWITIKTSSITKSTQSYYSIEPISLQSYPTTDDDNNTTYGFDYRVAYEFQIEACDGTSDYVLSKISKTVNIPRGIPVYDWGENDFNFNVPIMLNNVNLFDIIFPVGAVYMHSSNTLPDAIKNVGSWSSVVTGISGVFAWKRTS